MVRQPLTRQHRIARQWAMVHCCWTRAEWRIVVFSDESRYIVDHHDGRTHVWRRPDEQYTHHVLHLMTDEAVAQKWSGPVFGVQGEQI